jgi:protein-disulfide isomerase
MAVLRVPITAKDHIQGENNAPITLVEYGDYECPFCGQAYYVVKNVQQHYGRQLRFVFRNFPLTEIHPHAKSAAVTAEYAGAHRKFWEMHDGLYENQSRLSIPLYVELAELMNLLAAGLTKALTSHEYAALIHNDLLGGVRSGVNGTPTFFINNVRHDGSYAFEDLIAAIDAQLWLANSA